MRIDDILAALDDQITKLQQARAVLADVTAATIEGVTAKRRGRPKGSAKKPAVQPATVAPVGPRKRTMTPEGKARLVAALKARWAAKRKAKKPAPATVAKSPGSAAKKSTKTASKGIAIRGKKAAAAKKSVEQKADALGA